MEILPLQTNSPIQPPQSFFAKVKVHKTAIILSSIGFMILLGMSLYIISQSQKSLVSPATQENLPIITLPSTSPTKTASASPTLTSTPSPTPNPTQNWKTYTNSTYKYNIKYPSDWIAKDLGVLEAKIPSYIAFNAITASASARHITISVTTRAYQEQLALGASSSAVTYAGATGTKQTFQKTGK